MKNALLIILFVSLSSSLFGQIEIDRFNWNNEVAFKNSGVPFEKVYGPLSDSLSQAYDKEAQFYYLNNEYYAINTWADYFLWYTKKYSWKFVEGIHTYEYYYLMENNEEMMRFVFENSQLHTDYPIATTVNFTPLTNRRRYSEPVLFEKSLTSMSTNEAPQSKKKLKFESGPAAGNELKKKN